MSSLESILSEESKSELKNILDNEKNNLLNFKMQSPTYDVDTDGDEFQQNQKSSQSENETENDYKEILNEKTAIITQEHMEDLRTFSISKNEWELERIELRNTVDFINNQLHFQCSKANSLISKLEDYDEKLKYTQKELCSTQSKLEDKNSEVEKLYADAKTNEEELCKLRVQLDEQKKENDRLNEDNCKLEENLERTQRELNVQKVNVENMEEIIMNKERTISNELRKMEEKCKEFNDIQTAYKETKFQLDVEKERIKDLVSTLIDKNESSENNYCVVNGQKPQFQAEDNTNEDYVTCQLEKVLRPKSGIQCLEITDNQTNCRLERIRLFSEKLCEFKQKCEAVIQSEKEIEKHCNMNICCNTRTDCDRSCANTNAIVRNCNRESESNDNGDCYATKLKQLVCELENFKSEANLIHNE